MEEAASVDVGVLVLGETGAGKELVARAIHHRSSRARGRFQAVNCAAILDNLAEAELFGHARGAFTGANEARIGWFGSAEGGTLLLDEIGEMPTAQQAKLLRVLQHRRYSAVGESADRESNVRVIAATHCDLDDLVRQGSFRQDLLHRLNVLRVRVPTLRERAEDIPFFARDFAERFAAAQDVNFAGFANGVVDALARQEWPGNLRELENAMIRALLSARGVPITLEHVAQSSRSRHPALVDRSRELDSAGIDDSELFLPLQIEVERVERRVIQRALHRSAGNRTRAAALLGLNRTTLVDKIRKYNLSESIPKKLRGEGS